MASRQPCILIIDDEPNIHYSFQKILPEHYRLLSAHSAREGLDIIAATPPDVVVMDIKMPGESGLEALRKIRQRDARLPVIMMTAFGTMDTAITAMKYGAFEYLLKPFDVEKIRQVIQAALDSGKMMRRQVELSGDGAEIFPEGRDVIVGSSPPMQEIYKLIGQVAGQDVTVLLRGESGTGKELVARAIYQHSKRADQPFLEVNCAALPESLLESELFGYERGAFTGAQQRHIGKFEQVDGGTLFLDEIGEMPLLTQAKILRAIQYGEFTRVGGKATIHSNVRLIVATNRNLEEAVRSGGFREDLYYRLNVISIYLPPLRERMEDLPALIRYFVARHAREAGKEIKGVDRAGLKKLRAYHWPGNVRQLENCLRRAVVLAKGVTIRAEDLEWEDLQAPPVSPALSPAAQTLEMLAEKLFAENPPENLWEKTEELLIHKALERTGWNQLQAARLLGIHRNTLRSRMVKYGMQPKRH